MSINISFDETTAATQNLFVQEQLNLDSAPNTMESPYIDINGLAFADDDEIRNRKNNTPKIYISFLKQKNKEMKSWEEIRNLYKNVTR